MSSIKTSIIISAKDQASAAFRKAELGVRNLTRQVFSLQGALVGLGAGLLVREIADAGIQVQRLERAYTSILGSTQAAAKEQAWLRDVTEEMGFAFYEASFQYRGLLAAANNTAMEGQPVRDLFLSTAQAASALGLANEEVTGTLMAFQQMISKDVVSAEELRRQLGDRLPGAFQMAAEAMGVTTQELDTMLERGELLAADLLPKLSRVMSERFAGGALPEAVQAQNRLNTAYMDFKAELADSGVLEAVTDLVKDMTGFLKDPAVTSALRDIVGGLSDVAGIITEVLVPALRLATSLAGGFAERMKSITNFALSAPEFQIGSSPEQISYNKALGEVSRLEGLISKRTSMLGLTTGGADGDRMIAKWEQDLKWNKDIISAFDEQLAWSRKAAATAGQMNMEAAKHSIVSGMPGLIPGGAGEDAAAGGGTGGGGGGGRSSSMTLRQMQGIKDVTSAIADAEAERAQIRADFGQEYMRLTQGETAMALFEISEQARAWTDAGADKVRVAEWSSVQTTEIWKAAHEQQLQNARDWASGMERGLTSYAETATDAAAHAEQAITNGFGRAEDALVEFVTTGKMSFSDFANSIIADLARIAVQQAVLGPIAGALGGLFGGGGSMGGVSSATNFTSGIAGSAFAKGGVVRRPTVFPFASGIGLMGEAGAEAILPLTRLSNGDLGVASQSGGARVNLTIINETGGQAEVQQRTGQDGTVEILARIKRAMASDIYNNGEVGQAISRTFSLPRSGGMR